MIWKIWKKGKLDSEKIWTNMEERQVEWWNDMENMEGK
jgi:hypothetical protein